MCTRKKDVEKLSCGFEEKNIMPQIYSFFLIPQQYHLLHLEVIIVIYEQIPGKVPPGKAKLPFFSPSGSNVRMYEMRISYTYTL